MLYFLCTIGEDRKKQALYSKNITIELFQKPLYENTNTTGFIGYSLSAFAVFFSIAEHIPTTPVSVMAF